MAHIPAYRNRPVQGEPTGRQRLKINRNAPPCPVCGAKWSSTGNSGFWSSKTLQEPNENNHWLKQVLHKLRHKCESCKHKYTESRKVWY